MKKYVKWSIVGLVTIGVGVMAWRTFVPRVNEDMNTEKNGKNARGGKDRTLDVRVTVVRPGELKDELRVSGSLLPEEEVELSFESSGKITDLNFSEGARVQKGQLLARVNDAPLQAQLRKLTAQLKLLRDRLYRNKALLEKEAVSQEAFQMAEADLSALEAEIDMVKAQLAQTELRAPFDGVIGLRKVSPGAYATPQTAIATLTNTRTLRVEFSVPERYAGLLAPGKDLTFTVEGDLIPHRAQVYATEARVDAETRTYTVRARYMNADNALVPGRYVSVNLLAGRYPNALAVPGSAVLSEMGRDKVFLYRNGHAEPQEIVKGLRTDSVVQVVRGLASGDTVIVSGTMQLRTGQKVNIVR